MKLDLLKNTVLLIFLNLFAYLTITLLGDIYSTSSEVEIFERVHIGFFFLILLFMLMQIKKSYLFLISLFIIATLIGLVELNYFLDFMDSCDKCYLTTECIHDCDGPCSGWYTFECEKEFLFVVYLLWQVICLSFLLFVKVIFSGVSRGSYEKSI